MRRVALYTALIVALVACGKPAPQTVHTQARVTPPRAAVSAPKPDPHVAAARWYRKASATAWYATATAKVTADKALVLRTMHADRVAETARLLRIKIANSQRRTVTHKVIGPVYQPRTATPQRTGVTALGTGRCGGSLPPCYVMMRESGGSLTAHNPSSSAAGKWQFLTGSWAGYGGYSTADQAPESVQDGRARQLWDGGRGCSHWSAC